MFFYVISGFLISYALSRKYGDDLTGFYKSRILRIFPLYWFLYGVMVLFNYGGAADHIQTSPIQEWLPGVLLFGSDLAVSFIRYPNSFMEEFPSFLTPAWSLGAEVTFYAVAPFLLLGRKRICAIVLLSSVVIRGIFVYRFGFHETWSLHFLPATLMFFLVGHFSRILYENFGHYLGWINHIWLPIFFGLSAYYATTPLPFDGWVFYSELFALACALPFLFEKTKDIKWMNVCGDQSYPVYLSHLVTMSFLGFAPSLLSRLGENDGAPLSGLPIEARFLVYAVLFLLACLTVSFLLHFLVEIPLSALGAQLLGPRKWKPQLAILSRPGQSLEIGARQQRWRELAVNPVRLLRTPTVPMEAGGLSTPGPNSVAAGGHGTGR